MKAWLAMTCALLTACSILPPAELQTTPVKWWSAWVGLWTGLGEPPTVPAGAGSTQPPDRTAR